MQNSFAAFILTYGRPDNVITHHTLRRCGYTGKIYLIVDDSDKTVGKYIEKYGKEKVLIFSKAEIAKTFDTADNFKDMRTIVYARNAAFEFAKQLGIEYFIELDDDYKTFCYRHGKDFEYLNSGPRIKNLDRVFSILLEFYKATPFKSIAMAQGGDFIGGKESDFAQNMSKLRRKCMNSFICSTSRPFKFLGRVNEDVNTYTRLASTGDLFLTIPFISLDQGQTQSNSGGMTELYLDSGTYLKSFYTVMFQPSSVSVGMMGSKYKRLHHSIEWNNTTPVILSQKYQKKRSGGQGVSNG